MFFQTKSWLIQSSYDSRGKFSVNYSRGGSAHFFQSKDLDLRGDHYPENLGRCKSETN